MYPKHSSHLVYSCSECADRDAALRGLTRLNVLLTSATENESPQYLGAGHVSDTVLSSKRAKKVFCLSGSKTSVWLVFPL
jgi:hypothetical protein